MKKPVVLIIMDGYGHNEDEQGNAICAAGSKNICEYMSKYPTTFLGASGLDVGLPEGQMGNSEVGHTNIGAGRVVYQELTRITKAINDGDFFENEEFIKAIENCKVNNSALHLLGLVSDGGVHSHNYHLYALLKLAKNKGLERVYVHALLDGRDVPPSSAYDYIVELEEKMKEIGAGKIASVMGRYYAMDRDNRWDRVEKAYRAMVAGEGEKFPTAHDAVKVSYAKEVVDEFLVPSVIEGGECISANDSVIFFNFRPDRAREITRAFVDPDFEGFERVKGFFPLNYVCMTQYDATMPNVSIAFKPQELNDTFGEILSKNGLKQLRIAETEKYAHVTFFFNGGKESVYAGEDRCLIESPKVATYDLKPEMSAYEVKDAVIEKINSNVYDVVILNFANCDMVGHTGDFDATIKAVKTVDECVGDVVDIILSKGGIALITADHGNADVMNDKEGNVVTAHSTNKVPFIIIGAGDITLEKEGKISDICPTMLALMGIEKPSSMTGKSLKIN